MNGKWVNFDQMKNLLDNFAVPKESAGGTIWSPLYFCQQMFWLESETLTSSSCFPDSVTMHASVSGLTPRPSGSEMVLS